jgi:hypothetical protein
MTLPQLRKFIESKKLPDQWWVAVNGDVREAYENLHTIGELLEENPNEEVSVLHVSKSDNENAQWERVEALKVNLKPRAASTDENRSETLHAIDYLSESVATLVQRVESVQHDIQEVHQRLDQMDDQIKLIGELKSLFEEVIVMERLRGEFAKQQEFIEESERQLLAKTMAHEAREAELQQIEEDNVRHTA